MTEAQFREILQKYRAGTATVEEQEALIHWMDTRGNSDSFTWAEGERDIFMRLLDERIFSATGIAVNDEQEKARRSRNVWYRYAAAAAIIILIGAGLLRWTNTGRQTPAVAGEISEDLPPGSNTATLTLADGSQIVLDSASDGLVSQQGNTRIVKQEGDQLVYDVSGNSDAGIVKNTLTVPRGGQYRLKLPDGTAVWLNSASSITYPNIFKGETRKVMVTGEVYFEVAQAQAMPFIVQTLDMEVQVLGTHFNINAYGDEGTIMTTLLEGKVKVIKGAQETLLAPGQQAVASLGKPGLKVVTDADMEQVMSWKNGFFQFNEASLPVVLKQLERWYDVETVFEGKIPEETFVGQLPRNAPLSRILRVLSKMQVQFRVEGKKLIVKGE